MYAQVEKSKENTLPVGRQESRVAANSVAPKKSNVNQCAGFVDNRPETVVQRKLQSIIDHGAQPDSGVLQLISLNGTLLNEDIQYPNLNQANVLTHMAGEWQGGNQNSVTGGHLLTSMRNQWGQEVANSVPVHNANPLPAVGVHFQEGLPGNNITPHQHTFRLVREYNGGRRVSPPKASTFWPRVWSNNNLTDMLNNSFRCGNNNEWASKENMTYWYKWQTLGGNTLFPIAKVATATDTKRNKMKVGRT